VRATPGHITCFGKGLEKGRYRSVPQREDPYEMLCRNDGIARLGQFLWEMTGFEILLRA
jgi:hypothetical protein